MSFSINGLVTGIDTSNVISGLLDIQQSQVDRLELRKSEIQTEQAAFKGLETRVLSFRAALSSLAKARDGVFDQRQAESSDPSVLEATARPNAVTGTFSLRVDQLAVAEQLASNALASSSTEITHGDFTVQVGNRSAVTITVDDQNDTLQGLANALNVSTDDITATIIQDGSSARILLTSKYTGAENTINITNNLAADAGEAVRPDFSAPPIQSAQDATVRFGSGSGAITFDFSSNQVENLIEGVTLNLTNADSDNPVVINVSNDTLGAKESIVRFVEEYNALASYIDDATRYDSATNTAGVLIGNRTVRQVQDTVRNLLTSSIGGASDNLRHLNTLGISFNDRGQLFINEAKLDKVLNGNVQDVSIGDVKKLFALTGESSNSKIEFVIGSSRTKSGQGPIGVDVTQAAERASVIGSANLAANIVIDNSNNSLSLTLDGFDSGEILLSEGSYTQAEFAALVETAINADPTLGSLSVAATASAGKLKLTSQKFGSDSEISGFAGSALSAMGYSGTESDAGVDVAGNFIVSGVAEAAVGRGRSLTGNPNNAVTADMQVRVLLDATDVQAGTEGELTISRGYAAKLDQVFGEMLDPVNGRFKLSSDSYDQNVESVDQSISLMKELFESKQKYLIDQFTALESTISQLQNTGNFLSSQFSSLANRSK